MDSALWLTKKTVTTIVPVRKKLTDVALPTTQRQRQGGAEQLSPARYSKARITKPPEQHWKLHILSQHASVCKLGKASGRWYCSVCVCVCARWKGGFVLAIDCGPVRSNVSGLTQTNTDVEAVKKKKRLTWCFWCFPEVDREMPLQRIVGFAIVSDGNNDETNASAQKMPIWYRTLNKERWPPHIMDFLKKDHVGISLKNVGPCKILQLYSKYFLSWLMIDDSFLNGPLS